MNTPFKYNSVMVIDDDFLDRFVAQRLLTRECFAHNIISIDSATEGINYLLTEVGKNGGEIPSLIFLDITMPDMNGFDFLELYANLGEGIKQRNVIVLSSTLDAGDIARAKANPYVIKFVQKPITSHLKEIV